MSNAGSSIRPSAEAPALAVDFGGTKVEAALVAPTGAVLAGSRARAETGRDADSAELEAAVRHVVEHALGRLGDGDAAVRGVGIGSAGPVDRRAGTVSPLNVPAWRDYPLRDFVSSVVSGTIGSRDEVPIALEMDGIAIVLAEHWVGAAQGYSNVMGMVVSTGVGGGILSNGMAVTGTSGNAGHIGHIEIAGIEGENTFGNPLVLEAIASGPHTVAYARRQGFAGTTGEELAAAYAAGDPVARDAIQRTGRALGKGIGSAAALLDLQIVAIGGGFSQATPDLFDIIRAQIATHHLAYVRRVRVVPSALSGQGPLIGAAALIHRSELVPPLDALAESHGRS